MKEIVFGQDGDFSEERFRFTVNAHLANDIGNLTNRCLNLLNKNCDSSYPVAASTVPEDHPLRVLAAKASYEAASAYNEFAMHDAISSALTISGRNVAAPCLLLLCLSLLECHDNSYLCLKPRHELGFSCPVMYLQ
jgi:methionyl-tRNA synthetase